MFGITLRGLPLQFRWLLTLVLVSFALNHLSSTALVWEVTRHVNTTAGEHFGYKTLAALLRMTHQHTFGHGTMYFLTGLIFLFAGWPRKATLVIVTLPFVGAWLDILSWFLLKYCSGKWEALSLVSGFLYLTSFAAMFVGCLRQMWWPKPPFRLGG